MDVYRDVFNWRWGDFGSGAKALSEHTLKLRWEEVNVCPFASFKKDKNPEWFSVYSKLKHDKIQLSEKLDFLHCFQSLAALTILLIRYPYSTELEGETGYYNSKFFDASLPYKTRTW